MSFHYLLTAATTDTYQRGYLAHTFRRDDLKWFASAIDMQFHHYQNRSTASPPTTLTSSKGRYANSATRGRSRRPGQARTPFHLPRGLLLPQREQGNEPFYDV